MAMRTRSKGQTAMQLAMLIIAIVAGLIVMQVYLKRGIQGRIRSGVDSIGEQYDPRVTSGSSSYHRVSNVTTQSTTGVGTSSVGGITHDVETTTTRVITHYDNTNRTSHEVVPSP